MNMSDESINFFANSKQTTEGKNDRTLRLWVSIAINQSQLSHPEVFTKKFTKGA